MKKISLLTLTLFALSWATTTTPMFRMLSGRFGKAALVASAALATKFAFDASQKVKKNRVIEQRCQEIREEVKKKYHSNVHDPEECIAAYHNLLRQKRAEADANSVVFRGSIMMDFYDDPNSDLFARIASEPGYEPHFLVNPSQFPTVSSMISALSHEFVHWEQEHIPIKKEIYNELTSAEYPETEKVLVAITKCHEIEADSRSVFRGNKMVRLDKELLAGARSFLQHLYKEDCEEYEKVSDFLRPMGRELYDFETVSRRDNPLHPIPSERLDNLDKLEELAKKHGGTMPKEFLDKHIAENAYCEQAVAFLKAARECTA